MTEVGEDGVYCFGFLCVMEEGTKFGFGVGGEHILHDGGKSEYGSIDGGMGSQVWVKLSWYLERG